MNKRLIFALLTAPSVADEPPKEPDRPAVVCVRPLALAAGKATAIKARGRRLDDLKEVRASHPGIKVEIKTKGGADGDDNEKKRLGNHQAEIELTVPAEVPDGPIELVAVGPKGDSEPFRVEVRRPEALTDDKEPNRGFRDAQTLTFPATVVGTIEQKQDVDVFRVEIPSGTTALVKLHRAGSPLDGRVWVYDAGHQVVESTRDEVTLPAGTSFVVVGDVNDQGGPAFAYLLEIQAKP